MISSVGDNITNNVIFQQSNFFTPVLLLSVVIFYV